MWHFKYIFLPEISKARLNLQQSFLLFDLVMFKLILYKNPLDRKMLDKKWVDLRWLRVKVHPIHLWNNSFSTKKGPSSNRAKWIPPLQTEEQFFWRWHAGLLKAIKAKKVVKISQPHKQYRIKSNFKIHFDGTRFKPATSSMFKGSL